MAITSFSAALYLLPLSNSSISAKPKPSVFALPSNVFKLQTSLKYNHSSRVFAAPELLESQAPPDNLEGPDSATFEVVYFVHCFFLNSADYIAQSFSVNKAVGGFETPGSSPLTIGADVDKAAPKQKIRIKLRSYWVPLIEDSCKQIMDAARTTNAKIMGPVPLPTKKRIYCVLKSPHVHKDARFHFETRTHQRLIDILYPTAQTIDSLMQLDLPAGVDVEVKL
ncbi:hypothetical protein HHK36_005793 [Tetracentron sinense]|uniref:Small ribosomal subunit protein uS10c n=1 Tax=Tetracentron sinense TaxID=13715 RepID=A0A835DQZ7_TETSI|nr:hypothetical protein HHK36_005793 [Tetracentron sinense]